MKTISLLGSGWLGLPLAKTLQLRKYQLKASTRSSSRIGELHSIGIEPYLIDIDSLSGDIQSFLDSDILIINITSKNIASYIELINKIKVSSIQKLLFVSSSSVYRNTNQVVSESSGLEDSNNQLYKIENLFQASADFQTTVIRMSGLIGPGRHPGHFFNHNNSISQPDAPVNLIHLADCINIICRVLEEGAWGQIFNASADTHPVKRDFYTQAKKAIGKDAPLFDESSSAVFKIIDNKKVKRVLNYQFIHADLMALVTQPLENHF